MVTAKKSPSELKDVQHPGAEDKKLILSYILTAMTDFTWSGQQRKRCYIITS